MSWIWACSFLNQSSQLGIVRLPSSDLALHYSTRGCSGSNGNINCFLHLSCTPISGLDFESMFFFLQINSDVLKEIFRASRRTRSNYLDHMDGFRLRTQFVRIKWAFWVEKRNILIASRGQWCRTHYRTTAPQYCATTICCETTTLSSMWPQGLYNWQWDARLSSTLQYLPISNEVFVVTNHQSPLLDFVEIWSIRYNVTLPIWIREYLRNISQDL